MLAESELNLQRAGELRTVHLLGMVKKEVKEASRFVACCRA
jgi:hypothetical protein